jgi:hypothetical protein
VSGSGPLLQFGSGITASLAVKFLTNLYFGCRELLRNPEVMRRMLDPSNIQAMAQMRQAMDQLSAAGLGPNLGGLGGAGMGGGLGDLSGLLGGLPTGVPPVANPTEVYANELQQLVVSSASLLFLGAVLVVRKDPCDGLGCLRNFGLLTRLALIYVIPYWPTKPPHKSMFFGRSGVQSN